MNGTDSIRCVARLALVLLVGSCAPEPVPPSIWPVAPVEIDFERAGCNQCHGAGLPPAWASDATSVTSIRLERGGGRAFYSVEVAEDGTAKRAWTGPPEAVEWEAIGFQPREDFTEVASLSPAAWAEIAQTVVRDGLFRFDAEAVTNFSTHHEVAFMKVRRRDGRESILGSMAVFWDKQHPSLFATFDRFEAIVNALNWNTP